MFDDDTTEDSTTGAHERARMRDAMLPKLPTVIDVAPPADPFADWTDRFPREPHPSPLVIGLVLRAGGISIEPVTEYGEAFMRAHLPWLEAMLAELQHRFPPGGAVAFDAERKRPGTSYATDMADLVTRRMRETFGPLVQCAAIDGDAMMTQTERLAYLARRGR